MAARRAGNEVLRPSILDRLTDTSKKSTTQSFEGIGVRELKQAVARDLEWLLNTRIWLPWQLDRLEEASSSILAYGMPDLSTFSWTVAEDARAIARKIEEAIRTFEPRLLSRSIKCEVLPSDDVSDFRLRIRIEAILDVEPINEPVLFDTGIDVAGGGLRIESFE